MVLYQTDTSSLYMHGEKIHAYGMRILKGFRPNGPLAVYSYEFYKHDFTWHAWQNITFRTEWYEVDFKQFVYFFVQPIKSVIQIYSAYIVQDDDQCCVTRVGTRTRVHFTQTPTRVQFFSLWLGLGLGLGLRNRDSWLGPESRPSPSSSLLRWHSIHFVVCFHVLEDKQMLNMWTTRFVTRTRIFFWLGLGLGFDNLDSDTALMMILKHN